MAGVADEVKVFGDYRTSLNRPGAWLIIVPPVLLTLAGRPDFQLRDVFGLVDREFHNGYVGRYGHFIVLILATWYFTASISSWQLREAVKSDLQSDGVANPLSQTEHFFWRHFWFGNRISHRVLKGMFCGFPLSVACVIYFVYLWNYFHFHEPQRTDNGLHDLLLGVPDQGGFHGVWNRGMKGDAPWINASWQTWISIAGGIVLLFELVAVCTMLRKHEVK